MCKLSVILSSHSPCSPFDTYTQTKTTWNNSDWLVHKKATFYWSRFDTQMLTGLVNRSGKVGKMKS